MTLRVTTAEPIAAPAHTVWSILTDIERWPTWTRSVQAAVRLDDKPLAVGSRVRVKQPGAPELDWQVTVLDEPREFTWQARSVGVTIVAAHRLRPLSDTTTQLTLVVDHHGPLSVLVAALTRSRTRRFIGREASGLRQASEATTDPHPDRER